MTCASIVFNAGRTKETLNSPLRLLMVNIFVWTMNIEFRSKGKPFREATLPFPNLPPSG